jgi:hypothetical protein
VAVHWGRCPLSGRFCLARGSAGSVFLTEEHILEPDRLYVTNSLGGTDALIYNDRLYASPPASRE